MTFMNLSEFEKKVSSSILSLECFSNDDRQFEGQITESTLGDLIICEINALDHRVVRRPTNTDKSGIILTSVSSGTCYLERKTDQFEFTRGRAFLCRSDEFYTIETSADIKLKTLFLPYNKMAISERVLLSNFNQSIDPAIDDCYAPLIQPYLDLSLTGKSSESIEKNIESCFLNLLSGCINFSDHDYDKPSTSHANYLLKEIASLINQNIDKDFLSPSYLAKKIGYSKRYLNKVLSVKGLSLLKLIFQTRMDHVIQDLICIEKANKSIYSIANDYCFYDSAYFSRQFKSYTGLTPREFRMQKNPTFHSQS